MNEPANVCVILSSLIRICILIYNLQFCDLPCEDPFQQAILQSMPPPRANPPPDPNTPIFGDFTSQLAKREDYLDPPYAINNAGGALSSKTAFVRRIFSVRFI